LAALEGAARKFSGDWLAQVARCGLSPIRKVAEMFARHLPGLLNYLKHRITNAASEGIDSQVARIIPNARGLARFETSAPVSSSSVNSNSLPLDLNHSKLCGDS
jgi:transposase